ncbi:polynucleotide adenylyltransferase PcnB [Endozoicomonas sp. SM1973]|uniref:Poly(A) polymerase I n=1 Tax=Spartinivicinus marinus TaxID=2994442 RepID=A0A853I1M1_9GAMM|nr:polynucleotide adenylyltransferase PcnB [Spartinivicinus marinus]MCX4026351.1 polynucleotide adenylyltransferase PcnB [Spartinivicinus marinus]NYZ67303.1 polynucleotide adenylyltransferase PcnB [Spartinivicinus marinus]
MLKKRLGWLQSFLGRLSGKQKQASIGDVTIIPRDQHQVSRKLLSQNALKVLRRLESSGYQAYLVGGCIRDILVGGHPKDFDVATNATPEDVRSLFRNSRLIGRRFKLVHVQFGREVIEVATFRAHHSQDSHGDGKHSHHSDDGQILRDNVYGTVQDDASRRDFTINALYYRLSDFAVKDYAGGLDDIDSRLVRLIGDPEQRYREDPVRMLRAIRFAAKLDFTIEKYTAKPLYSLGYLLENIPPARLFDEVLKLFLSGHAAASFQLLQDYGLLEQLLPATAAAIAEPDGFHARFIHAALVNSDKRVRQGKSLTPAFLYAVFLWYSTLAYTRQIEEQDIPTLPALNQGAMTAIENQNQRTTIPKRFAIPMREIWELQYRLTRRFGKKADQALNHPRFRAAYDFLLLREQAGEDLGGLGQWWTDYQEADEFVRRQMVKSLQSGKYKKSRKPRRHHRKHHHRKPNENE